MKGYLSENYRRYYLAVLWNHQHIDTALTAIYYLNRRQHYYKLPVQALPTR